MLRDNGSMIVWNLWISTNTRGTSGLCSHSSQYDYCTIFTWHVLSCFPALSGDFHTLSQRKAASFKGQVQWNGIKLLQTFILTTHGSLICLYSSTNPEGTKASALWPSVINTEQVFYLKRRKKEKERDQLVSLANVTAPLCTLNSDRNYRIDQYYSDNDSEHFS